MIDHVELHLVGRHRHQGGAPPVEGEQGADRLLDLGPIEESTPGEEHANPLAVRHVDLLERTG
jgi:hypothetical protein